MCSCSPLYCGSPGAKFNHGRLHLSNLIRFDATNGARAQARQSALGAGRVREQEGLHPGLAISQAEVRLLRGFDAATPGGRVGLLRL